MEAGEQAASEVSDAIRTIVIENTGLELADGFSDTDDLFAAGLQSLHCVRVLLAVEDDFDIEIPQDKIDRALFSTINNLAAAVAAEKGGS